MPQDPPPPPPPPPPPVLAPQWDAQEVLRGLNQELGREKPQFGREMRPPPPPPPKPPYVIPEVLLEYWQEAGPDFVGPPSPRTEQWLRRLREAMRDWQNQGGGFA